MLNYKQILTDITSIFSHHEQIRSFGFGDLSQITNDITTKQEPEYIRAYIVPGTSTFNQYHIHYDLAIIIMDKIEDDLTNLKDVMSDTLEITKDIWTVLYQSYNAQYGNFSWYLNPDQPADIKPFMERFETIVGGFTLNISVSMPFDYNSCNPPVKFGYGFPQDQTFESYRVVVDDFEKFALLHEQINSFGFGEIDQMTVDIITKKEPEYPRMYVMADDVKLHSGHIHIMWKIIFSDKIEDDLSNQEDVLNDTLEMAKDLFSKMYLSEYEADWDAKVEPFLQWYETILGGWLLNISMTQKFDYNRCVLPLLPFATITPTPTPSETPVTPTPTPQPITPTPTPTITPSVTPVLEDGIWQNVGSLWDSVAKFWGSYTPVEPTPTPTASITPTPSITPTFTPTASITPTITPTNTVTPTVTLTMTPTSSITPTPTPSYIYIDVSAAAFINAAGITGFTNINAINNLVKDLKANDLWNKMVVIYPFIQGTPTSTKYNLKDPRDVDEAYRIRWFGNLTFNTSGITTNNSFNAGGDTYWSPYIYNLYEQIWNNLSVGVYRTDQNLSTQRNYIYGVGTNGGSTYGQTQISDWTIAGAVNHHFENAYELPQYTVDVSSTGTTGMFITSRTSDSLMRVYKNGSQFGNDATGTVPYPSNWFPPEYANASTIKFFQLNRDGLPNYQSAKMTINFFHLSLGLSDAEAATLYTIVQTYNQTLNRAV